MVDVVDKLLTVELASQVLLYDQSMLSKAIFWVGMVIDMYITISLNPTASPCPRLGPCQPPLAIGELLSCLRTMVTVRGNLGHPSPCSKAMVLTEKVTLPHELATRGAASTEVTTGADPFGNRPEGLAALWTWAFWSHTRHPSPSI
mgnify:CR=1 FL=1